MFLGVANKDKQVGKSREWRRRIQNTGNYVMEAAAQNNVPKTLNRCSQNMLTGRKENCGRANARYTSVKQNYEL